MLKHRYGFGTYIHYINGYYSKETNKTSKEELARLIRAADISDSNVYVDTMVSPSYTTAIAQALQLPSVSGKDINMMLFEFSKSNHDTLSDIMDNYALIKASGYDTCILSSCGKGFGVKTDIHIWIKPSDYFNANLMILLGYVIIGHPQWKKAQIKIFALVPQEDINEQKSELMELIETGRLPISAHNILIIEKSEDKSSKDIINEKSKDADLTIVGFRGEAIKQLGEEMFSGYDEIGNVLYVNSTEKKEIK